ncbi:transporter substrate-binding domain-containing protein [Legionella drancourtii]|uniref:Arginine ABC transporter, periplasmic binding protein n=1 Tax=Legionella drancourtii LLAP12 TaxID=658187 RepID=G9ENC6_9GAMM|nr:transporter substrate-binding domain-containing protein [Legionella drancourtii]EHL31287.1 arginine ABC transporter, periplasmic binding protein [Legionella drancourtii LLAP12]
MNFIRRVLLASICLTSTVFAADLPVLNIGTESFNPPFVMQGSKKEIYGFDIDMMNTLCKIMQRTCQYHIMRFDTLIDAVARKEIDMAISSITITPERAKIVNFSLPYLPSYSRFVTKPSTKTEPFTLAFLNGKRIGLETGTIFPQQLDAMGVKNPKLKMYASVSDQLTGLNKNEVDIILLDNPTATYWASNSSDTFQLAGPAYMYGYGLGIAVNPSETSLLTSLNQVLLQYQNSTEYKQNYDRYLLEF